jgi:CdiI immunity protein
MTDPAITRDRFPRLADFSEGYLHQDVLQEYGSAEEALRRYLEDAGAAEAAQLRSEWRRLLKQCAAHRGRSLVFFQGAFRNLGAAWIPQTAAELDSISGLLSRP